MPLPLKEPLLPVCTQCGYKCPFPETGDCRHSGSECIECGGKMKLRKLTFLEKLRFELFLARGRVADLKRGRDGNLF